MAWIGVLVAAVLIFVVFVDAFEAMMLPRRVRHSYRLAPLFYGSTWVLWQAVARRLRVPICKAIRFRSVCWMASALRFSKIFQPTVHCASASALI